MSSIQATTTQQCRQDRTRIKDSIRVRLKRLFTFDAETLAATGSAMAGFYGAPTFYMPGIDLDGPDALSVEVSAVDGVAGERPHFVPCAGPLPPFVSDSSVDELSR